MPASYRICFQQRKKDHKELMAIQREALGEIASLIDANRQHGSEFE